MDKLCKKRSSDHGSVVGTKRSKIVPTCPSPPSSNESPTSPDSTQPDNTVVLESDVSANYRRFSARERKKTRFFNPYDTPSTRSKSDSDEERKYGNHGVCRALDFDRVRLVLQKAEPGVCMEDLESGITISAFENDSIGTVGLEPEFTMGRTLHRVPKPQDTPKSPTVSNTHVYPEGSMVVGKLPGYDWWPGMVMYQDTATEKEKEENDCEKDEDEEEPGIQMWVRWFGDNQLSKLSIGKLVPFEMITSYLVTTKLKGLYRKAVMTALKEGAKRCGKTLSYKMEDRKLRWVFYPSAMNDSAEQSDDSALADSSSNKLFVALEQEEELDPKEKPRKERKAKGKERGGIVLTGAEKELLEWAFGGFLPTGPEGLKPKEDINDHWRVVPLEPAGTEGEGGSKSAANGSSHGPETKHKSEVMLVHTRKKVQFQLVRDGQVKIEDVCIGCGVANVVAEHPLFYGGLCKHCKIGFLESAYLFDDDGTQMYCTICSGGHEVFMCDTPNCSKVYCAPCIEKLCGAPEVVAVKEASAWSCYMCSTDRVMGLLKRREDCHTKLHELFLNDIEMEYEPPKSIPPIPAEERKPLRVLGLFDGIATGFLVLKELGFVVDKYVASEIDMDAVNVSRVQHKELIHVGSVERITEKEVRAWGPFDLVMGGSPCNDLSIVNPARKGIYDGTGKLFFEFFRILRYCMPPPEDKRPFFWLYENVVSMRAHDKQTISRFLQSNPVVVDAKEISAAHRARYFWGNLPGMNRPTVPLPGDRLTLQECLEPNCFRIAQFTKLRTITTKMNSIKQTKKALMPVRVEGEEEGDVLWCTEMERLFGFPDHYTDAANLGRSGRQRLLGKAWSVPVVRHILSPLKDYFQSSTTGIPSSVKMATNNSEIGETTVNP